MSKIRKRTAATTERIQDDVDEKKKEEKAEDLPTYCEIAKFVLVGLSFGLAIMIAMHGTRFIGMWLDGKMFSWT
ncbi:hypothetical protein WJX75_005360 [Coccomyxa subellipsoidea]|uniref:Uncharacterized protein n=1 Tax=Coccomyxa subellipsoidea TaxID=248742 RepID=A0ABR2Z352_9CHLO